jgi:hypothetical protein
MQTKANQSKQILTNKIKAKQSKAGQCRAQQLSKAEQIKAKQSISQHSAAKLSRAKQRRWQVHLAPRKSQAQAKYGQVGVRAEGGRRAGKGRPLSFIANAFGAGVRAMLGCLFLCGRVMDRLRREIQVRGVPSKFPNTQLGSLCDVSVSCYLIFLFAYVFVGAWRRGIGGSGPSTLHTCARSDEVLSSAWRTDPGAMQGSCARS